MMRFNLLWFLFGLLLFTACADIGITKRKHRPGFYIQFAGQKLPNKQVVNESKRHVYAKPNSEVLKAKSSTLAMGEFDSRNKLSFELSSFSQETSEQPVLIVSTRSQMYFEGWNGMGNRFSSKTKSAATKVKDKKKALNEKSSNQYGQWETIALIAFCSGLLAFLLVIFGLAFLITWYSNEYQSEHDKPVLGLLATGGVIGLLGLISGAISRKQAYGKHRRLAISGLIFGIASLGLMVLTFLAMAFGGLPNG
jgi:hypothetical protein